MLKALISIALVIPAVAFAAPKQVNIDSQSSTVTWSGGKAFTSDKHSGSVALSGGSLMMDGEKITGGELVVDMTTIKNEDIKDAGMQAKLVGHLHSPDFFDTTNHKQAKFVIKKATAGKNGEYTFSGDMTIRGKTQPQTVKAKVVKENNLWVATGTIEVDRTKFDVKYNSKDFFPDMLKSAKDKVINNNISLSFTVKTAAI